MNSLGTDLLLSDEQRMMKKVGREFLEEECPIKLVRSMYLSNDDSLVLDLWKKIAKQGWAGLVFDTNEGGMGLKFADLVVIMEEMGRVLLPGPFFSSVLLGGMTIEIGGSTEQKRSILPSISAGDATATLGWLEEPEGVRSTARISPGGYTLNGRKLFVVDGHMVDDIIAPFRIPENGQDDRVVLFVIPSRSIGVEVKVLPSIDRTRKVCTVVLNDVQVGNESKVGGTVDGWSTLETVRRIASVGLCAEMIGGAQRVLEKSVEYAKTRTTFGHPIGSYQAIKHGLANVLVEIEKARALTYAAASMLDEHSEEKETSRLISAAKYSCNVAYLRAAMQGIQTHGGIGFTWDNDLHLYLRRAKASEVLLGDSSFHKRLIAQSLLG